MEFVPVRYGLSLTDPLQVAPRHVHHGIRGLHVQVLQFPRQRIVQARRKARVHVRARQRVVQVEDEREAGLLLEQDAGQAGRVRHHEDYDGVIVMLLEEAARFPVRRQDPEHECVGPDEPVQEFTQTKLLDESQEALGRVARDMVHGQVLLGRSIRRRRDRIDGPTILPEVVEEVLHPDGQRVRLRWEAVGDGEEAFRGHRENEYCMWFVNRYPIRLLWRPRDLTA